MLPPHLMSASLPLQKKEFIAVSHTFTLSYLFVYTYPRALFFQHLCAK